ncbi:MAG TPA: SDR family NAD(P)-dependent oxidoreductase [Steroidobacteraceae bacterium]|nr:SDR family NAD(P)-dependent oxidoreductase [Steroidobacteraceae bacterium]
MAATRTDDKPDSVAWIAGVGASAGLGAALARRFSRSGMLAIVTGRHPDRLQAVAAEIAQGGGRAVALAGDLSVASEVERLAVAVRAFGSLRAAIFNAGQSIWGSLLEISPQQFEEAWRTSAYGGFLFARAAVPALLEAGGGSLLISGATASIRGRGPFVAFAAAKAALRSLAQSTAREFGPRGVHVVHVIIDGGIDGERLRTGAPARVAAAGEDGLLHPDAIAETYWQLHQQQRSAWTHELDLRPFKEAF